MSWILLTAGLILLVAGAELLVRGAAGLATRFGISPLVVGLTVVAFGTSAPEVAVSLSAVADGKPDIAVGNAVGSNTFNVLFILGLSALLGPLVVAAKIIRIDVPIMIGVAVLLWVLSLDGRLTRVEGGILFAGIVVYTVTAILAARRESAAVEREFGNAPAVSSRPTLGVAIGLTIFGLALAVLGARLLVKGSVAIASALGVSELVIGLTVVAAGTSLPEVATSLVAAVRGQRDIAVGNVVGSNIFNVLCILGLAGIMSPEGLPVSPALLAFDMPVMVAVAVACLPIVFTGSRIQRWEGGLLLAGYVAYVTYLILEAGDHDALSGFSAVMLWFALPLATLGLAGSVAGSLRRPRR